MKGIFAELKAVEAAEKADWRIPPGEGRSYFFPRRDPKDSHILVHYLRERSGAGDRQFVKVQAHLGNDVYWAFDLDEGGCCSDWAGEFDSADVDGMYVLTATWVGRGEDSEFITTEQRPLNEEERFHIIENDDWGGIYHAWVPHWQGVSCRHCGELAEDHEKNFRLECPVAKPTLTEETA